MRLTNPEARWVRANVTTQDAVEAEARRCLGHLDEPVTPLSGGLANLVLRIGDAHVLRIYRRDASSIDKELALLQRRWRAFRVPRVLARGDDHLLLEHIPHGPLEDDAASGAALGAALAEIHGTRLPQHGLHGFIDETLRVVEPMADIVGALLGYARQTVADMEASGAAGDAVRTASRAAIATLDGCRSEVEAALGPPVLLHGDFKVSNLHRAADGALLVLDWEFAFAGPALCDIGQLMRWDPSKAFQDAFADGYRSGGGALPPTWRRAAALLDLGNLVVLLARAPQDARRVADLRWRMQATVTVATSPAGPPA
ncbi:MAG: aminoglycoside phosphotransferase family protein [Polyangiaceae bacterium]